MLILTRKVNETITIGDNVEVTVIEVKGKQVRLGIAAPRAVPIHRTEVKERIDAEEMMKEASAA